MSLGVAQGREFTVTEGRAVCQGWGGWREMNLMWEVSQAWGRGSLQKAS